MVDPVATSLEARALPDNVQQASLDRLFQLLESKPTGLGSREAARRLKIFGPNVLARGRRQSRWAELAAQFTHPLALLLAAAAVLSFLTGNAPVGAAVMIVIIINAVFAFFQEQHAEHAVEALAAYLPEQAAVLRDARRTTVEAAALVPGDVLIVEEGSRISADARLLTGTVDVDLSTLTGESQPVTRSADAPAHTGALVEAPDMVFSGSACLTGEATALVTRTGMRTEIGRIATLSQRSGRESSPLERQVKSVAKLIVAAAVAVGLAFLPVGLAAGLSLTAALTFAIGLIVANVPEGLLPTITLALAAGVQELAQRGAVVKRLSAVETLGSATVICTDKTGTLTQNRMQVVAAWTPAGEARLDPALGWCWDNASSADGPLLLRELARAGALCSTATLDGPEGTGDPTELALLRMASSLGVLPDSAAREGHRLALFRFDPRRRLMSTADAESSLATTRVTTVLHSKGAPEAVLERTKTIAIGPGVSQHFDDAARSLAHTVVDTYAQRGWRVLAVARRCLGEGATIGSDREAAEWDLCLLGLVALVDPARPEVAGAVERAHRAGIRIHVVTGDNGLTAREIARQVGIGTGPAGVRVVPGEQLAAMSEADLDALLDSGPELVFARSSPEAKLRIAEALHAMGEIVAMTGDGVNDAPALRTADIGVAMGRSGTQVAREAATMVLTDDNFATIVRAVEEGRRVYDNVRRFIVYIFTHAVPEVVPFLVFALSGGAIPLPLTVMEILAIDLGTDLLPALALGREAPEPGVMERPPRPTTEGVIGRSLLFRAWGYLGPVSVVLVLAGFLLTLHSGGWHLSAATGAHTPLHHVYQQATTVAWLGIVACQIGTAFAARTERVSIWRIGPFSNRRLLGAIAIELLFAGALVFVPFLHGIFGTAALRPSQIAIVAPFPLVVWGADEIRRWYRRRHASGTNGPGWLSPRRAILKG